MSSNDDAAGAEKRKEKLEVLRARRITNTPNENAGGETDSPLGNKSGKKGKLRGRFLKALAKRRQDGENEGSEDMAATSTRGRDDTANRDNIPRKKKRAMLAKRRGRGKSADAAGVDASSTLEEISDHRRFLEARINKLRTALDKRSAELVEVTALEAAQLSENKAVGEPIQAKGSETDSK